MMTKQDKAEIIKGLQEWFSGTHVALLAHYSGLDVTQVSKLRSDLRKAGAVGRVTRNTLAKLAAEKAYSGNNAAELKKLLDLMTGPTMFIFSKQDPVSPARVLSDFAKKVEKLQIRGGYFEGSFLDASGVKDLASMPSKEESQAKLLATMMAPATQLVRTMVEPASMLVRLLEARRKQLEEQAGGAQA